MVYRCPGGDAPPARALMLLPFGSAAARLAPCVVVPFGPAAASPIVSLVSLTGQGGLRVCLCLVSFHCTGVTMRPWLKALSANTIPPLPLLLCAFLGALNCGVLLKLSWPLSLSRPATFCLRAVGGSSLRSVPSCPSCPVSMEAQVFLFLVCKHFSALLLHLQVSVPVEPTAARPSTRRSWTLADHHPPTDRLVIPILVPRD